MIQLMHGDCLERMKEVPDGSVDMVLADPPYGTTACKWDTVIDLPSMWTELKRVVKTNGAIVMTASQPFTSALVMSNAKAFKYCWTWKKERGLGFLNAKKMPLRDTEDVCVFYYKQPTYNPQMRSGKAYTATNNPAKQKGTNRDYAQVMTVNEGERQPLTTLEFTRPRKTQHPTQKPVPLMEYLIRTYTNEGETVLDFTMGSGTTGVACKNLNRNFIGIELDEKYFAIADRRIAEA